MRWEGRHFLDVQSLVRHGVCGLDEEPCVPFDDADVRRPTDLDFGSGSGGGGASRIREGIVDDDDIVENVVVDDKNGVC